MGIMDIIGPVMVGPSSSHTAGACRIGLFARQLLGRPPRHAQIDLHGSFAATGEGHGTPLALVAGLLGFGPEDERIPDAFSWARKAQLEVAFERKDLGNVHPNSARIHLDHGDRVVSASSVGGGRIHVWGIDGFQVDLDGEYPTVLVSYPDQRGVLGCVGSVLAEAGLNIATIKAHRTERGGEALMTVELDQVPSAETLDALNHLHPLEMVRFIPGLYSEC